MNEWLTQPKIEQRKGVDGKVYWCVIVPSPVVAEGIIQGVWCTREQAEADMRHWQ